MAQPSAGDDYADYADPFSVYGKAIIDEHHDTLARRYGQRPIQLPPAFPDVISRTLAGGGELAAVTSGSTGVLIPCPGHSAKVGIIGAGVGGLYAAMMLESLDIDYEILEASERVGGRLYTHPFSKKEHDYFVCSISYLILSMTFSTICVLVHRMWGPCVSRTHR